MFNGIVESIAFVRKIIIWTEFGVAITSVFIILNNQFCDTKTEALLIEDKYSSPFLLDIETIKSVSAIDLSKVSNSLKIYL